MELDFTKLTGGSTVDTLLDPQEIFAALPSKAFSHLRAVQEFLEGRAALQDQVYIRALAVDFFVSLLHTADNWAERTLAEIEGWEDLSPDGKNDRGLEIMAGLPVATPGEHTQRTPVPPRTQRRPRPSG